jgi:signal transduction histidine kinase
MWFAISARHLSPILPEAVYIAGIVVAVCSRASKSVLGIISLALFAIALCILLDTMTKSDWGVIGLYIVIATVVYRLPLRLSVPVSALAALIVLTSEGLFDLLLGRSAPIGALISQTLIIGFAFAASLAQRTRHLLITQLERTQAQLRDEMERTAELAAARERARIARDVHDVLAHSLTVLSVQAQALRQLVRDNPERAAALLDQMAEVLRESQVESRQIVGLLREANAPEAGSADLAIRLRVLAERFAERTGMRCALREHGAPRRLSARHAETLRFALQEALTNAYRHGNAAHAEADLWWELESVRLIVCDDGASSPASASRAESGQGRQGLRGMRERAEALGGMAETGPRTDGGFVVTVTLPFGNEPGEQPADLSDTTSQDVDMGERAGKPGEASV